MKSFSLGPIIACATGMTQNSGVSVIRLSGFDKVEDLQIFFSFDLSKLTPRKAVLSQFFDPTSKDYLDEGLLLFFKAPHSFTGENVLEFQGHGNPFLIQRIIESVIENSSFKEARAGEFTYRALKNGKLTLAQVEGLDLLINSTNSLAQKQGMKLLDGELFKQFSHLRDDVLQLKSAVDLSLDFSEDVGEEEVKKLIEECLSRVKKSLGQLYLRRGENPGKLIQPEVALFGTVNAGKSTLFNRLLGRKRAIVSETAGTTRDYLLEFINFRGVSYGLTDTAGIREATDIIEREGIEFGRERLEAAFFRILVVNPLSFNFEDFKALSISYDLVCFTHALSKNFKESAKPFLDRLRDEEFIFTDFERGSGGPLPGPIEPATQNSAPIGAREKSTGPIGPREKELAPIGPIFDDLNLREEIFSRVDQKFKRLTENSPLLVERQISHIKAAYNQAFSLDLGEEDLGVLSHKIYLLSREIEGLVGIVSPDEVLNNIFSSFCIGK